MSKNKDIVRATLVVHTAFEEAIRRIEQCFTYSDNQSEPICIALVGESRTGKSRVLEEIRFNHPKVRTPEGLDVPILYVKLKAKPTVKGLAELMLHAIGDPKYSVGTENTKTIRLQTLISNAGTRMVMIDEFQHFYDRVSHKVMHHVADWLKILVDDCRVALVVSGLPSCQAVLKQNEQLLGRFLAPVFMPRFNWRNDTEREEFITILEAFHETLAEHFDIPALGQPGMAFRCYCGTGGLIGYLTKFLNLAVWNALDNKRTIIDLEDLLKAHNEAIWTEENISATPNPFSRAFNVTPTDALLAQIRLIGIPAEETTAPRKRINQKDGRRPTVQSVLTAN
jgi:hypothetical protein